MLCKSRWVVCAYVVLCLLVIGVTAVFGTQRANLYAGTSYPGCVWSYDEGSWQAVSPVLGRVVLALVEYKGEFYAGTRSSSDVGQVYRWKGKGDWVLVGNNLDYEVLSLVVYKGALYAGTGGNGGRLYRYGPKGSWTCVVEGIEYWTGMGALYAASDGWLYLGDSWFDYIARFDGESVHDTAYLGGSCIYDFAEFEGDLYAAAWAGRIIRSNDGMSWSTAFYYDGYAWGIVPFQGCLFTAYESGDLRRWNSDYIDEVVWTAPNPIISMVADANTLYFGTGGEAAYLWNTSGSGVVYRYNGQGAPEQISDVLGVGVQCMCLYEKQSKEKDKAKNK